MSPPSLLTASAPLPFPAPPCPSLPFPLPVGALLSVSPLPRLPRVQAVLLDLCRLQAGAHPGHGHGMEPTHHATSSEGGAMTSWGSGGQLQEWLLMGLASYRIPDGEGDP